MSAESYSSTSFLGLPRELRDSIYLFAAVPESRIQLTAVKCNPSDPSDGNWVEDESHLEEESAWYIVAASPRLDKNTKTWSGTATWVNLSRVSIQVAEEVDGVFFKHAEVLITDICFGNYEVPTNPLVPPAAFDRFKFITFEETHRKLIVRGTHTHDRPFLRQRLIISPSSTKDGRYQLDWKFGGRVFMQPFRKVGYLPLTRDDNLEIGECLDLLGERIWQLIQRKWRMLHHILDLLTAPERFDIGCQTLVEAVARK
ncbi:hypothetical protein LTR37_001409 [Vermiconidia calcicola]|uniref:Uncharacterized protein n=1 Tax=Vermiconidia calcicola TaxID=1690605 RepID=A0ACC3NVV9_9PEZI|nr:hypothetical protein LTR37_001409 [Vermiconidia calcicola]